ncbi:metalloreductase [Macrophomina phaseolina]|uniref:ferric-chelate reductase (NADPH) n=1 Tax=Macrophomina phaseolina TaxID=35725 RepID=A0ABQ8GUQ8_9PEZI|nr:metalloreductase [Macrophomina phaseolina]
MKVRRHDHDGMDMDMGGMDMGSSVAGVPSLDLLMQYYWAVVGSFIGIAALVHVANVLICRQRLSAACCGHTKPAKPEAVILRINATATAIVREASNATFSSLKFKGFNIHLPTVGKTAIVAGNLVITLVLCFYKFDLSDQWSFEDIAYRTGCISLAQLPLIFLLAGKNNIIGWLTGTSYERLNWLHRWVSRCLLLTVTIHMGYWFADWAPYNYIGRKIKTDPITQHGLISWCLLLWIVLSSVAPIRGWRYEIFVIQHLGSMAAFLAFVYKHINSWPLYVRIYVYLPIALVCLDRIVRTARLLYVNLSLFHPRQRKDGHMSALWAANATFTPLSPDTTRISIANPPIAWTPGQHVFLSCHSVVPLQSHPFTIASLPADGRMDFYVKGERGATRRFFSHAEKLHLASSSSPSPNSRSYPQKETRAVAIDGPYGRMRPLRQFDSIVLFAGSTGATFTVPLLREVVEHWKLQHAGRGQQPSSSTGLLKFFPDGAATRCIRFIWVVKSRRQLGWFAAQLSRVMEDAAALRRAGADVEVEMSVYVTCDPAFTDEYKEAAAAGAAAGAPSTEQKNQQQQSRLADPEEKRLVRKSATVREIEESSSASSLSSSSFDNERRADPAGAACAPDGTCYCQSTVIEDDDNAISPAICTCYNGVKTPPFSGSPRLNEQQSTTPFPSSSSSSSTSGLQLHPSIALLSGRPHPENVTRKVLERALGESAVVVCGPHALARDVRAAVVRLSDERAVHRGTGAQGIWLHVEGFGF